MVLPWVVGVNKVDELVVPLVAAAVHARHDLSPRPAGKVGEMQRQLEVPGAEVVVCQVSR